MNQAIVIATTPKRYDILQNCLNCLNGYDKYQILILSDYTYFTGKMQYIVNKTTIDEFTIIPDSMEIKDTTLFDLLFETHKGKSVSFMGLPYPYWMLLGKFKSELLHTIAFSDVTNKREDLDAELYMSGQLVSVDPDYVWLFDDVSWDHNESNPNTQKPAYFEEKFGRMNLVAENDYFKKFKGTWSYDMAEQRKEER